MQLNGGNYGGWEYEAETKTIWLEGSSIECELVDDVVEVTDVNGATWRYDPNCHHNSTTADFLGMK